MRKKKASTLFLIFSFVLFFVVKARSLKLNSNPMQAISASANLSVRSVILNFKSIDDDSGSIKTLSNLTDNQMQPSYLRNATKTKRSPGNDVVSKNITMVLENLLKNYERTQLPTHGKGKS